MKRIILVAMFFTFSLGAKTLDNKAFCEAIEQGREANSLKNNGQSVKAKRLLEEVESNLKTMITVGTEVIPDEKLRVLKRRGRAPEYLIECLTEKNYYKQSGSFWICYNGDKNNCAKNQLTDTILYEKLEEEVQGKGRYNSLNGSFFVAPSQYPKLFFYDPFDGLKVHAIISKIDSISKVEID